MIARTLRGAAAGALATGAMSALMLAGARAGWLRHQPPKRIARAFLPGHRHRPKPGEGLLGTAAHFGFGAASGALFGLVVGDRRPRVPAGVVYGLAIWAASYQGWVPRMQIMPPISHDRPRRQAVMAGAHVVYGAALVLALNRLTPARRPRLVETEWRTPNAQRTVAPTPQQTDVVRPG
jgi:hypothetical protein